MTIAQPDWVYEKQQSLKNKEFTNDDDMMRVAIELSADNIKRDTGGPFGTAIYERDIETKKVTLLCCAVNQVVNLQNCCLHGETSALMLAGKMLGSHSLREIGNTTNKEYIMCTSCEPCCMCLGATLWSGVHEMYTGGTKNDAQSAGFDEGPVNEESYQHLERANIKIKRNILQADAAKVLKEYGETGVLY